MKRLNKINTKIKKPVANKPLRSRGQSREKYLIKRTVISLSLSTLIIVGTYFWMVFFISNVGSFWDLFRKKDLYEKQNLSILPAPYLSSIPESSNVDSIDIVGRSKPGVKIELYSDNSRIDETITDSDGNYYFTGVKIGLFPQTFYTRAIENDGSQSKNSISYTITYDNSPPEYKILQPSSTYEDFKSTERSYVIRGETEPESKVTIQEQFALVSPDGKFSLPVRLEEGNNYFKVTFTDLAGNQAEEEININYTKIE